MDALEQMKINLRGLEETERVCHFQLSDSFFAALEGSQLEHGNVDVSLTIRKMTGVYELTFDINGEVTVSCDRCLDDMQQPIAGHHKIMVKLGEEYSEADDTITIDEQDGTLDVAWLLYEYVMLAIPIQHFHKPGGCNAEMTSKLSELNAASEETSVDPRWEKLLKLKEKSEK